MICLACVARLARADSREHHADHDAPRRVADRGAAAHELAAAVERLERVRSARRDARRREVVGRGANAVARQSGDSTATNGTTSARCPPSTRSIHLDEPDAALRDLGLDRAADGDEVPGSDCRRRSSRRFARRGRDARSRSR